MLDSKILEELDDYIQEHLTELSSVRHQLSEKMEDLTYEEMKMTDVEDFIESNRQPSFNSVLFGFIDQKGVTDPELYKKAGIDRKLFSKIRSKTTYRPGKNTILALALALELNQDQTEQLLSSAGHSLSNNATGDLVIQFCLKKKIYDIDNVNQALVYFNEKPLTGLQ
ncbi:hypothetical protein K8O68_03845 [Salipaludibacillus sp. CUR1]|uniref:hypothetical protein n=1 Tax=Salipaludibacillus sp. CUR1 TaxID=2820003 RepID=UPI001E4111B0|nr:hypothetical protein [Salipaludibacillus sp. CUR1]MCE7791558.1 hypothetical protein [Salipaludibacillus sp. CUR1]